MKIRYCRQGPLMRRGRRGPSGAAGPIRSTVCRGRSCRATDGHSLLDGVMLATAVTLRPPRMWVFLSVESDKIPAKKITGFLWLCLWRPPETKRYCLSVEGRGVSSWVDGLLSFVLLLFSGCRCTGGSAHGVWQGALAEGEE